jgi:hypothetical protein
MGALFSNDKKIPSSIKFDFLTGATPPKMKTTDTTKSQGETKVREGQDAEGIVLSTSMQEFIARGKVILQLIDTFPSTREQQREAMQKPKDKDIQNAAFDTVLPNALLIKKFFLYSNEMEEKAPMLLTFIIERGVAAHTGKQQQQWLEANQNVVQCLCDILTFALTFDNIKQRSPDVQNDFAYYRRNIAKFHDKAAVGEAETNTIAMWLAAGNPMLTRLTDAFGNVYSSTKGGDGVKHVLSNIANVTCSMLMRGDVGKTSLADPATENTTYCLCLMTSAIILFDRVVPTGVFRKNSGCEIKKCVLQLKANKPMSQTYLQCVRFATIHFGDKDTPASLSNLIEEARATQ